MSELTVVLYKSLGLPIPKKREGLPANYNELTKKVDKDNDSWAEPHEFYDLVFTNREEYASVRKKLRLDDPFKITPKIEKHVWNVLEKNYSHSELEKAIVLFRSIVPRDKSFTFIGPEEALNLRKGVYQIYEGLKKEKGGLEICYGRDQKLESKIKYLSLLPEEIMASKTANCAGLSYLLVAFLRVAGNKAWVKIVPGYAEGSSGHVYVIARIGWYNYRLDPTRGYFFRTEEEGSSDREGLAAYYVNKGLTLFHRGKLNEARKCYEIAIELNPDFAAAWNNLGGLHQKQKKFKEAERCYEKALELEPRYVFAWMNKGSLLENEGDFEKAKECYEKVIEIKSDFAMAWLKLSKLLEKHGRSDEARRYYKKAIELDSSLEKEIKDQEDAFLK